MVPKGAFLPFLVHFLPEKDQMVQKYCFCHFHSKTISKKGSHAYVWPNLKKYVFWPHFRARKWSKWQKNIVFIIFHLKTISKKGSHAYVWPNLKKYVFWSQKRLFDPFSLIFGPEKGQNGLKIFFSHFHPKTISKKGSNAYVLPNRFFGPKRGFLTLFGPFSGPNRSKWPKIIFFVIRYSNDFQRGVTCLCSNKNFKNGKNELFWGFLKFWGAATGQKSTFSEKFKKHLEIYS